jgi:hypothetical protein
MAKSLSIAFGVGNLFYRDAYTSADGFLKLASCFGD